MKKLSLDEFVQGAKSSIKKVKDYLSGPNKLDDMVRYGIDNYLDKDTRDQLFQNKTEQERMQLYDSIRQRMFEKISISFLSLGSIDTELSLNERYLLISL